MPIRGSQQASTFDGENENLLRFFEDVSDHADLANINDPDRIKWTVHYANVQDSEMWKLLPTYAVGNNFDNFKAEVIALYPGIDSNRKYTVGNLEQLVDESRQKRILSKETLGEYHRNFIRISLFLIGKGRISAREQNRWYLQGFQMDLQERITQRLAIVKSDINPNDSYDYMDIYKSPIVILNCSTSDSPHPYGYANFQLDHTSTPAPTTSIVKTEYHDHDIIRQLQAQVANLAQLIMTLTKAANPTSTPTITPSTSTYGNPCPGQAMIGSNAGYCHFCSAPNTKHYMRQCPIAEQYIRKSKCVCNPDYCIVLPMGEDFPRAICGQWFQERLDNYHQMFPGKLVPPGNRDRPPHMTTAFFKIVPVTEVMQFEVSRVEERNAEEDPDVT
jgi:hypothetical protein